MKDLGLSMNLTLKSTSLRPVVYMHGIKRLLGKAQEKRSGCRDADFPKIAALGEIKVPTMIYKRHWKTIENPYSRQATDHVTDVSQLLKRGPCNSARCSECIFEGSFDVIFP